MVAMCSGSVNVFHGGDRVEGVVDIWSELCPWAAVRLHPYPGELSTARRSWWCPDAVAVASQRTAGEAIRSSCSSSWFIECAVAAWRVACCSGSGGNSMVAWGWTQRTCSSDSSSEKPSCLRETLEAPKMHNSQIMYCEGRVY